MKGGNPQMRQMDADGGKRNHPRKSALQRTRSDGQAFQSADSFSSIVPRAIEVHIEELVLHGFDPRSRWAIGEALENELRRLLAAHGVPAQWQSNPANVDAGSIRLTGPTATGKEIAGAGYRGGNE